MKRWLAALVAALAAVLAGVIYLGRRRPQPASPELADTARDLADARVRDAEREVEAQRQAAESQAQARVQAAQDAAVKETLNGDHDLAALLARLGRKRD